MKAVDVSPRITCRGGDRRYGHRVPWLGREYRGKQECLGLSRAKCNILWPGRGEWSHKADFKRAARDFEEKPGMCRKVRDESQEGGSGQCSIGSLEIPGDPGESSAGETMWVEANPGVRRGCLQWGAMEPESTHYPWENTTVKGQRRGWKVEEKVAAEGMHYLVKVLFPLIQDMDLVKKPKNAIH